MKQLCCFRVALNCLEPGGARTPGWWNWYYLALASANESTGVKVMIMCNGRFGGRTMKTYSPRSLRFSVKWVLCCLHILRSTATQLSARHIPRSLSNNIDGRRNRYVKQYLLTGGMGHLAAVVFQDVCTTSPFTNHSLSGRSTQLYRNLRRPRCE